MLGNGFRLLDLAHALIPHTLMTACVTGRPLVCGKLDHGQRVYSYELLP